MRIGSESLKSGFLLNEELEITYFGVHSKLYFWGIAIWGVFLGIVKEIKEK